MPAFSIQRFAATLSAQLPSAFSGKFCVAFSGGVDSTVLLHSLAALREAQPTWSIRAIHINHQLQAVSTQWAQRCKDIANDLQIPIQIEPIQVDRDHVQGLEAAARDARYAVFNERLQPGEVLLTAHHADDQVETLLLALMRGAGVQGLAAMPRSASFAHGWHLRPLLDFTRSQLTAWAIEQGVESIEDPTNRDLHHDRNYLRHAVLPVLRERWPSMAASVVRTTQHLGDALELLAEQARHDQTLCAVGDCLDVAALQSLTRERRANLLRHWLRLRGLNAPSTRQLLGLEHDIFNAADDRNPFTTWAGAEVHRYRGRLYAFAPLGELQNDARVWNREMPLSLPQGLLRVELAVRENVNEKCVSLARLPEQLTVRYRTGGEHLHIAGRAHRKLLKKILQESGVLPWWRDRLPLIFAGKQLVAVGDVFIAQEFAAAMGEPAARIVWERRPDIFAPP